MHNANGVIFAIAFFGSWAPGIPNHVSTGPWGLWSDVYSPMNGNVNTWPNNTTTLLSVPPMDTNFSGQNSSMNCDSGAAFVLHNGDGETFNPELGTEVDYTSWVHSIPMDGESIYMLLTTLVNSIPMDGISIYMLLTTLVSCITTGKLIYGLLSCLLRRNIDFTGEEPKSSVYSKRSTDPDDMAAPSDFRDGGHFVYSASSTPPDDMSEPPTETSAGMAATSEWVRGLVYSGRLTPTPVGKPGNTGGVKFVHPAVKDKTPILFVSGQRNDDNSLITVGGRVYTQAQFKITDGVVCRGWVELTLGILPNEIKYFGHGRHDSTKPWKTFLVTKRTRLQPADYYPEGTECRPQGVMSLGVVPVTKCSYSSLIKKLGGVVGTGTVTMLVAASSCTYAMVQKNPADIMILRPVELIRVGDKDNTMICEVDDNNEIKETVQDEVAAMNCLGASDVDMKTFCTAVH